MTTESIVNPAVAEAETPTYLEQVYDKLEQIRTEYIQLASALGDKTVSDIIGNKEVFDTLTKNEEVIFASDKKALEEVFTDVFGEDLGLLNGARAVNMGSGWGFHSRLMNSMYGLQVIDLEISPLISFHAEEKNEGRQILDTVSNIQNAPLESGSVDLVFSHGTIRYLHSDQEGLRMFSETMRILKPGGKAIIGDVNKIAVEKFRDMLNESETDFYEEARRVSFFRATTFYCLYALYSDLNFSDPKITKELIGDELIKGFRSSVDQNAAQRGIKPIELLIEMAGTEEKTLTYFVIVKKLENQS